MYRILVMENVDATPLFSPDVLTASGKTPNAVASEIGKDRKTVVKALKEPETTEQVHHFQLLLADKFQLKAEELLDSIDAESIGKLNGLQAMTAAGIVIDKSRTIRGLSNSSSLKKS